MAGSFSADAILGDLTMMSAGGEDAFVVTLSSSGTADFARSFGAGGNDRIDAIQGVDPVVIGGTFAASVDFGAYGGVATSSDGSDIFVIRHALP
jgi:myo-inositol-hexaphosphate 3-phosphohydrolase